MERGILVRLILSLAFVIAAGGVAAAQSPAPSGSPPASPAASPASDPFPPRTKLVTTCEPYTNLRSVPNIDTSNIVKDSSGSRILLKPGTEIEVATGGANTSGFIYVQAPSRDGPTNGYVGRVCVKRL
jgi:hypothetical protein